MSSLTRRNFYQLPTYLSFNGASGSFVQLPVSGVVPNGTAAFSAAVWIYLMPFGSGSTDHIAVIIGNRSDSATAGWTFKVSNKAQQKIEFVFYDQNNISQGEISNVTVPSYRWTHIGVTFDGRTTTFYIDGNPDQKSTLSTPKTITENTTQNLQIGHRQAAGSTFETFPGTMGKLSLWNRALTAAEFQTMYNTRQIPASSLLANWEMNEGSGTTITDTVAGVVGTLTGGVTWATAAIEPQRVATNGRIVTAVQNRRGWFANGSDGYITAPSSYIIPQSFSIGFWYYPIGITANDRLVDQSDAGPTNGFTMVETTTDSPQFSFQIKNGGTTDAGITSRNMKKGQWNYITATFTTNSAKLYVNGVQQGATDTNCAMTVPAAIFTIGRRTGASNFAKGNLDDFSVFNKVLSQTEINALYQGNQSPTDIGNCDIWYKMTELSGTNVKDYSGNGRDGTRTGAAQTAWITEPSVRRLLGAGTIALYSLEYSNLPTAVVSVADTAILRPETTSLFTLTGWINLSDTRQNVLPRFWEKGAQFWCFMGDQTNTRANQLALEIANNDSSTTEYWGSTHLQAGQWYFIATTFDGTSTGVCQHYVNGELEAMTTLLGPYAQIKSTAASSFNMGNNHSNNRNLSGALTRFKFYNVVLSQSEIQQIMYGVPVSRGLTGEWNYSEGSGSTVADSSGNGNNGTITAAMWQPVINSRSLI